MYAVSDIAFSAPKGTVSQSTWENALGFAPKVRGPENEHAEWLPSQKGRVRKHGSGHLGDSRPTRPCLPCWQEDEVPSPIGEKFSLQIGSQHRTPVPAGLDGSTTALWKESRTRQPVRVRLQTGVVLAAPPKELRSRRRACCSSARMERRCQRSHRRARAPIGLERGGGTKRGEVVTRCCAADQRWQECAAPMSGEKFVA